MEESALWIWDAVGAREAGLGRHLRFCDFKVWGAHLGEALLILASLWFCRNSKVKTTTGLMRRLFIWQLI